jgi:hypothetical protein
MAMGAATPQKTDLSKITKRKVQKKDQDDDEEVKTMNKKLKAEREGKIVKMEEIEAIGDHNDDIVFVASNTASQGDVGEDDDDKRYAK